MNAVSNFVLRISVSGIYVDLTKLNETALGVEISKSGSIMSYSPLTVEKRKYEEYMIYGPIPFAEVMKWSNLEQNAGWK